TDRVVARPRSSRLRLFQSQHSREQRRRLFDLPRAHRSDADHLQGVNSADGVVSGLSPKSREVCARERQDLRYAMLCREKDRKGNHGRKGVGDEESHTTTESVNELLDMPSVDFSSPLNWK